VLKRLGELNVLLLLLWFPARANASTNTLSAFFQEAGVTNLASQNSYNQFVAGMQSLNLWTNVVETAWFSTNQNIPVAPSGHVYGINGNQGLCLPGSSQVYNGAALDGINGGIIFSNLPPTSNNVTLLIFCVGRGWEQTPYASWASLQNGNNSKDSGRLFLVGNDAFGPVTLSLYDGVNNYQAVTGVGNSDSSVHMLGEQSLGGTIAMYQDNTTNSLTVVSTPNTNIWTTLALGCDQQGSGIYGDHLNGLMQGFILLSNSVSPSQINSIYSLAQATLLPWCRTVFEGDSIMFDCFPGSGQPQANIITNSPLWGSGTVICTAVPGELVQTMIANFPVTIATNAPNRTGIPNGTVLLFEGGENSLANVSHLTGADCYNLVSNEIANAHQIGFYPVAVTTVMHSGSSFSNATTSAVDAYNALVRANTAGAELIIDQDTMISNVVHAVDPSVTANYWTNSALLGGMFFMPDGTHPINTGNVLYQSNLVRALTFPILFPSGPSLGIAPVPGSSNVVLFWPTNATGFAVQSESIFPNFTNWQLISNPPVIVNTNYVVTNTPVSGPVFYRLIK
jgi:hypothetical protein